jgi:hypothetical protein
MALSELVHSHDTPATALAATNGEGRSNLLSGLIGLGHKDSVSSQPQGLLPQR